MQPQVDKAFKQTRHLCQLTKGWLVGDKNPMKKKKPCPASMLKNSTLVDTGFNAARLDAKN